MVGSDCTKESGTCNTCRSACTYKPGWLRPGDAERIAGHLHITLTELFETKLAVDWWEGNKDKDIFVLAPALVGEDPGEEYPGNPKGTCVFFAEGQCSIHKVKPFECREYVCSDSDALILARKRGITEAWMSNQEQITSLLGREPVSERWETDWLWS